MSKSMVFNFVGSNNRTTADGGTDTSDATLLSRQDIPNGEIGYGAEGRLVGGSPFKYLGALGEVKLKLPQSGTWKLLYANNTYLLVYPSKEIAYYSSDGITWKSAELPNSSVATLAYGNGIWLTAGATYIYYSYDLVTWKSKGSALDSGNHYAFFYGGDKFIDMVSGKTSHKYSYDGLNWTAFTTTNSWSWNSGVYAQGKYVVVGSSGVAVSEDGITWVEAKNLPASGSWYVTYGNGKFVAVMKNSTNAAYSEDGLTWTATTLPVSSVWGDIAYGNGRYVAIQYNATADTYSNVAYSEDGINWYHSTMPVTGRFSHVEFDGEKFVSVADSSDLMAVSYDGANWTQTGAVKSYNFNGDIVLSDGTNHARYRLTKNTDNTITLTDTTATATE